MPRQLTERDVIELIKRYGRGSGGGGSGHTRLHSIISALDHTSNATPGYVLMADANGLPVDATVIRIGPNFRGLLRELPSLPSQNAILLGWASELPVMVNMNYLSEDKRPQSEDPDFWKVWTGEETREIDWKAIADDWQKIDQSGTAETAEGA